ncbi:MAG TPA: ABC transporter permease [Ardenticatenaceae bacterium]|jgi:osmoprotectant transport system permease protein
MELLQQTWEYGVENSERFWEAVRTHLELSGVALGIAVLLCVPLALWIARRTELADVVINGFNAVRVVPSLAILFLAIPYLGLGRGPALVALTVLACPPVLINSYAAFRGVNRDVLEAARGMGMSEWQVLRRVEFPLALPIVLTGIRTAAIEVISSAALAALISAGGLGDFVVRGMAVRRAHIMLAGAIPIALLALLSELILSSLQRWLAVPEAR